LRGRELGEYPSKTGTLIRFYGGNVSFRRREEAKDLSEDRVLLVRIDAATPQNRARQRDTAGK